MDPAKLICVAAILLIIVVVFYKCPSKAGFKVNGQQIFASAPTMIPNNVYNPVAGLNGSQIRPGDPIAFADMVVSPTGIPVSAKDRVVNEMGSPDDYLPTGMANVYVEDAFNSHRATVRLQKSRLSNTPAELFNLGAGEALPIQSVHKFTDHTIQEINPIKFDVGAQCVTEANRPKVSAALLDNSMLPGFSEAWDLSKKY